MVAPAPQNNYTPPQEFFETKTQAVLCYSVSVLIFLAGVCIPYSPPSVATCVRVGACLFLMAMTGLFWRDMRDKRPVLILTNDAFELKGLTPGRQLFQYWCRKKIPFSAIENIALGRVRPFPAHVPSSSAYPMRFIWVTYRENGDLRHLYYPWLHQIRDWSRAIDALTTIHLRLGTFSLDVF